MLPSKNSQYKNFNYLPLCQICEVQFLHNNVRMTGRVSCSIPDSSETDCLGCGVRKSVHLAPNKTSASYCCFSSFSSTINPSLCGVHIHEAAWKAENVSWFRAWPWHISKFRVSNLIKIWTHDLKNLLYVAVSQI